MNVLGVSFGYHDASASLVVDGRLVAAAAEERFTRQKHDANFPTFAIESCLAQGGLGLADVDHVVFHEDPHTKFTRVLTSSMAPFPGSRREFVNTVRTWIGKKLWALGGISARLDVPPERIHYLGHHFSHAVQAFLGAGVEQAAILVVDAVGDWSSTALFRGRWVDGRPQVERIVELAFPNSLGLVYSAFTAYLGFRPNDSECSTMALAAFGQPRFVDAIRQILRAEPDGSYTVDQRYFHFSDFYKGAFTPLLVDTLGPARSPGSPIDFDCFAPGPVDPEQQRFADVAASLQQVIEERILGLAGQLHQACPSDDLCLAGGVALNCVANARLLADGPFARVHIPPDPGDGGTAVATALYFSVQAQGGAAEALRYGPYFGASDTAQSVLPMLAHVNPAHVRPYTKPGVDLGARPQWSHQTIDDPEDLCAAVAERLMAGQIVGWFQGRFELGPRALGNRSILCRPDDPAVALRLSTLVKERARYRPYAFSVTRAGAAGLLDLPEDQLHHHRWMQFAAPVRAEARDTVRAALHVDGTTRPQVVHPGDNPAYHRLLDAFGARFGTPVLLNTSFNPKGYPIVSTAVEALAMFARTDMDALVIEDTLLFKGPAAPEGP